MIRIYLFIILVFSSCFYAQAQNNDMEIVAIVEDDAISSLDVKKRVDLAIASSGLSSSDEVRGNLRSQIVRLLIDEKLYEHEAKKYGISVSQQDVKQAMMTLEERNKIKYGTFKDFLKKQNIPVEPALEQLKSQLLWNKLVSARVRPDIIVTDREVEEKLEHISHNTGLSELKISEIVLPIDEVSSEKQVRKLASRLVSEIRDGAKFDAVAKEFSRSSTASSGGDMGWVREEHLAKEMANKIGHLAVGEISDPFRIEDNYYILKLDDRRAIMKSVSMDDKISFKQAMAPAESEQEMQKKSKEMADKISSVKSCDDFEKFAKSIKSTIGTATVNAQLKDLNEQVRNAINETMSGHYSDIIKGPSGLYIFMVCDRSDPTTTVVLKNKVREMLLMRKIDLQSQRYLRELRSKAFIEVRDN